ncbi:MAG: papain fold toxin domain-containing protein, partial [Spirulinaceae cyanobacterium]
VSSTVDGVTTSYLLDSNRPYAQVLAEYTDGALAADYVYGWDLISQERDGDESFYLVDGLGSTRVLTDENGVVSDSYTYDAFGNLIGSIGSTQNDYLFAGEQFDERLEQYYLRQRYYDTATGRFSRRDTYEGRQKEPITLHKYVYGNSNPIHYTDPSGLFSLAEFSAAESIRNTLASLQIDSGQRLIFATINGDTDPSPASIGWDTLFGLGLVASVPLFGLAVKLASRQAQAIIRTVSRVATRFKIGECDSCALAVKTELVRKGINGRHIRIETVSKSGFSGNIYSKKADDLISFNGYHEAIVVEINGVETVFDNISPEGIPKKQWLDDLETVVPLKTEIILDDF